MRRPLILGGGGLAGIAWETGLLAGLADAGIDVLGADLIVGTSAGSTVGAQAASGLSLEELFRRQVIASRLPAHTWPHRRLAIVAVNAATGQRRIFERGGGAGLVDAAASCAVPGIWPPVSINGHRYIDGGSPLERKRGSGPWVRSGPGAVAATAAMGAHPLDPAVRAPAARAGSEQGRHEALHADYGHRPSSCTSPSGSRALLW